jgi:hypothetical protein
METELVETELNQEADQNTELVNVTTSNHILSILLAQGYEASSDADGVVLAKIANLPVVFHITDDALTVNCKVAVLGDIPEELLTVAALAVLSANTVINPFAFALIDATDDPSLESEDYQIILTDKVPVGSLQPCEVVSCIDSLWKAIAESRNILRSVIPA